jgi:hypothetical protein
MACRIQNLGKHRLALDLRGGSVIYLKPGEVSRPIREELLYGHIHLPQLLAQGLVRRIDAKMSEVLEHEQRAAAPPASAPPAKKALPEKPADKDAREADVIDTDDAPAESSEGEKPKSRSRSKDGSSKTDK